MLEDGNKNVDHILFNLSSDLHVEPLSRRGRSLDSRRQEFRLEGEGPTRGVELMLSNGETLPNSIHLDRESQESLGSVGCQISVELDATGALTRQEQDDFAGRGVVAQAGYQQRFLVREVRLRVSHGVRWCRFRNR